LCIADKELYNVINLDAASALPVMPVSQMATEDPVPVPVKPLILVISENEFLIVSNMDGRGMGVFITGNGDPVRGTLEWPAYPESMCESFISRFYELLICAHDLSKAWITLT
jgi:vacuolar protein sorting-associated protein 3